MPSGLKYLLHLFLPLSLSYVCVVHLSLKSVWRNGTGFILVSPLKETQASVLIFPRCSLPWLNTALQEKTKPLWMQRVFLRIQRWPTEAINWCVHSHIIQDCYVCKKVSATLSPGLICRVKDVFLLHGKYSEMRDLMHFWSMCLELNSPVGDGYSHRIGL